MKDGRVGRLLADPTKWTKGVYARNVTGNEVSVDGYTACCFCLAGAVIKLYPAEDRQSCYSAVTQRLAARGRPSDIREVSRFNDDPDTSHDRLMEVIKEAGI